MPQSMIHKIDRSVNYRDDRAFWRQASVDELAHWHYLYGVRLANLDSEILCGYPDDGITVEEIRVGTHTFIRYQLTLIEDELMARERAARRGVIAPGPRFDPEIVAELKSRVRLDEALIVEVGAILRPLTLGDRRSGPCPWCGGKSTSTRFQVYLGNTATARYHCYGACGRHGDLLTLIQERHGLSFPAAVKYLAEMTGTPLPSALSHRALGGRR